MLKQGVYKLGYRIQYGPMAKGEVQWNRKRIGRLKAKTMWLLAVLSILLLAVAQRHGILEKLLIPGNPEVTKAAYIQFKQDVKEGEPVGEAITAFCRTVIENANIE